MHARSTPTQGLRDEHQWILKVTGALEGILDREPDQGLDFDALEDCVSFTRLFADACHHGQEEDLLFPELEAVGLSRDGGPLAVMLHEHREGRAFAKAMADALPSARTGDGAAQRRLLNAGLGYVSLIRGHILKEDNILFNMADQMIGAPACRSLCAAYDGVCQRRFDGCTVAELEAILTRLLERYPQA